MTCYILRITDLPEAFTYQELEAIIAMSGSWNLDCSDMYIDQRRSDAAFVFCPKKVVAECILHVCTGEKVRGCAIKIEYCDNPPYYLVPHTHRPEKIKLGLW
uniref:RRM domain-containing protein n=1 Tax=Cuerna arida TaxID=1464854 RepID=A0A1B6H3T4_9HEMI